MNFIKKHSSTIVGIVVFFVVLISIFALKNILASDEPVAIYGTRLDGRSEVEISKSTKNKVENKLKESASNVDVRIAGRIVNILIKANAETSLDTAKQLGSSALEEFSKKEKEYYDFQIFIENDANANQFPIIGYKHHTTENISWTKDRAES